MVWFINPNRATTSCLRQRELLEAITKVNPKHDAELVKTKREEIQDFCKHMRLKSRLGNLLCFFRWVSPVGRWCVWLCVGKTNLRIEVPIRNEKDRQTYYGRWAQTKEFIVQEYSAGNGENTVVSLNIFKSNVRVAGSCWDGAAITRVRKWKHFGGCQWGKMRAMAGQVHLVCAERAGAKPGRRCMVTNQNSSENTGCCVNRSAVVKWLFKFFTSPPTLRVSVRAVQPSVH